MIRVLELVDGGFLGGGQMHILSIANNINRNSFDITISASPNGEFKNLALKQNHKFIGLNLPKIFNSSCLKQLMKIVDDNGIELIHSHGGVAGVYSRILRKKLSRVKVVHTIHGIHYINSKNIFRKFLSKKTEQYLVKYTDRIICVSEADLKIAVENKITDAKRTAVIKNGINLQKFAGASVNPELANRLGIGPEDIVVGNISRFDYQKNQRFLIHSVKEIIKQNKNIKLLLTGDGKYLEESKSLVKKFDMEKQSIFTGEVPDPENYYPLIDIFVFPPLWEGLSITLIEAMASGRCIAASDIPANRELIKNNYNGLLFRLENREVLTNIIKELIQDKSRMETLSFNAVESSKQYDEKEMVRKIENIYTNLF